MPRNFWKVVACLVIILGDTVPIAAIMSFASQLFVQLGFNQLGILVLFAGSVASVTTSLLFPALLLRFSAKQVIVVASIGIT